MINYFFAFKLDGNNKQNKDEFCVVASIHCHSPTSSIKTSQVTTVNFIDSTIKPLNSEVLFTRQVISYQTINVTTFPYPIIEASNIDNVNYIDNIVYDFTTTNASDLNYSIYPDNVLPVFTTIEAKDFILMDKIETTLQIN